jgi:hypothetical protein
MILACMATARHYEWAIYRRQGPNQPRVCSYTMSSDFRVLFGMQVEGLGSFFWLLTENL